MHKGGDIIHMKTDEKLALNLFHVAPEPHIQINNLVCDQCPHKLCTLVCPVENYQIVDDKVVFSWEGCLECGTCRIVCDQGAMSWEYPHGSFGVIYRF